MRKLPKTFKQKGFTLTQIKRDGNKAIFKKTKTGHALASYEVIVVSSHNGYELGGQKIESAETYPSSSLWGIKGFTCTSLERAEVKYKTLKD